MVNSAMPDDEASDEMLMRLADNELPQHQAARLRARLASDPELARRFALFAKTREAVSRPFDAVLDAKVPDALTQAILSADAAAAAAREAAAPARLRPVPVRATPRWLPLMAASVAALLAAPLGYLVGRGGAGPETSLRDPMAAARQLVADALDATPSGLRRSQGGVSVQPLATHPVDGGACRDFLLQAPSGAMLGIACREAGGWTLRASVRLASEDAVRTASPEHPVLAAVLEGLGAGPPLDQESEAALLRRAWR